jgi:hypothetical protein
LGAGKLGPEVNALTTFNKAGLDAYGRRMMDTFHQHWSCGVTLHVYYEDWNPYVEVPHLMDEPLFKFHSLVIESEWLRYFKHRHRDKPVHGFKLDAVRFAHKVAALLSACAWNNYGGSDYLIWLDGDIVTHQDFDEQHLLSLLPPHDALIAWLDRARAYPECGFYIVNCMHPLFREFCIRLRSMYADDELFHLKEWHDSYVMEQTVKQLGVGWSSLSGSRGRLTHHPLVNGPLAQWFDHLKGARKGKARTPDSDIVYRADAPHWERVR